MTEILTESFCERCGTRYTFEPVDTRRPLASIGTFGRGLRHFFTDPGSTLGESFAVARSESEQRATTHALEAFHQTFNFCLTCRQYVCGECWNAVEGRCLTCAPVEEPAAVIELAAPAPAASLAVADIDLPRIEVVDQPIELDVEPVALEEVVDAAAVTDRLAKLAPQETAVETEIAPVEAVAEAEPAAEAEPVAAEVPPAPAPLADLQGTLLGLEPGRSLDAEIAAYEEQRGAGPETPEPEAVEVAPEPEPFRPVSIPAPWPIAEDQVAAMAAPGERPALESLPPIVGPTTVVGAGHPAGAPISGARACPSCGLSLSVSARFCRRCGTAQQQAG